MYQSSKGRLCLPMRPSPPSTRLLSTALQLCTRLHAVTAETTVAEGERECLQGTFRELSVLAQLVHKGSREGGESGSAMVSSSRRERSGVVQALAVLPLLLLFIVPANAHSLREVVPTQVRAQLGSKRTEWHDLSGRHCPLFAHGTSAAFPMPASHTARSANSNSPFKLQLAFDAGRVVTPWVSAPLDGSSSPSLAVTLSYSGDALTSASVEPEESVPSTSSSSDSLAIVRYYWYRDAEYDGSLASVCVAAGCGAVAAVLIARALRGVRLDQALLLLLNPAAPGTGTSPSVEQ